MDQVSFWNSPVDPVLKPFIRSVWRHFSCISNQASNADSLCTSCCFPFPPAAAKRKKSPNLSPGEICLPHKGDSMRAILEYKNALQIDPKNPRSQTFPGQSLSGTKGVRPGILVLFHRTGIIPRSDEARVEVASLLTHGQPQRALDELSKINKPESFEPKIRYHKGTCTDGFEEYSESLPRFLHENLRQRFHRRSPGSAGRLFQRNRRFCRHGGCGCKIPRPGAEKPVLICFSCPSCCKKWGQRTGRPRDGGDGCANQDESALLTPRAVLEDLGMPGEAEKAFEELPG